MIMNMITVRLRDGPQTHTAVQTKPHNACRTSLQASASRCIHVNRVMSCKSSTSTRSSSHDHHHCHRRRSGKRPTHAPALSSFDARHDRMHACVCLSRIRLATVRNSFIRSGSHCSRRLNASSAHASALAHSRIDERCAVILRRGLLPSFRFFFSVCFFLLHTMRIRNRYYVCECVFIYVYATGFGMV